MGEHLGLMYYTLGQRKGLGIGGCQQADDTPWFVVDKDIANNILLVGQGHDHPMLMKQTLEASRLHWISAKPNPAPLTCQARIRHRQPLQSCSVLFLDQDHCRVEFEQPQRAVTPGQSVVFYLQDTCLGGGIIERAA